METDSTWGSIEQESAREGVHKSALRRWRDLLREDIATVRAKDPAARTTAEVLLAYPGLHAIILHRLAHGLWMRGHLTLARVMSHVNRLVTGIEIHPGARIGHRFFIDHGAGVVIGETSEIGDDVLMYTGAILGGTTNERAKRHPTLGNNVVVGSHAVILGNIKVGDEAKIGSGSVVVESVPAGATVVGVPGRIVRLNGLRVSSGTPDALDHGRLPDPILETLKCLVERVETLENQVRELSAEASAAGDGNEPAAVDCTWWAAKPEEQPQ